VLPSLGINPDVEARISRILATNSGITSASRLAAAGP
jgi:hypothetical protein